MFKKIIQCLELKIQILSEELNKLNQTKLKWSEREKWDLDTGKKFNDLVSNYPISEDELLSISETVCEFVQQTRITNIEKYLFINEDRENPRLPYMLK